MIREKVEGGILHNSDAKKEGALGCDGEIVVNCRNEKLVGR